MSIEHSLPQRYFPLLPPTSPWCRLLFYASISTRAKWIGAAETTRRLLGVSLVVVGLIILFGADKVIETWLVDHSPTWLTELTTRL